MGKFLSIIMPTNGSPQAVLKTLTSLLQNCDNVLFELIIVNDGGNIHNLNKKVNYYKNNFNIVLITNKVSTGSYAARNQGIAAANGDWLLFADDNLTIPSDWWEIVRPHLPRADFICSNVQVQKKEQETLAELYHRSKGFRAKPKFKNQNFGLSTFLLVSRNVFDTIGFFDERLYSGGDLEFSQRVYHAGFRQIFLEDLEVYHEPKRWRSQFFTITRIIKGCQDLADYYPNRYAHLKLRPKDLFKTIKYQVSALIFFNRTKLYQSGEVNFLQHELAQLIYFSLHFSAQFLVLTLPHKKFNW